MNEQQAIDALLRGDIGGLEFLVRKYQVRAIRAAFLITRDQGIAQEVVQSAFLQVAKRIEQFDRGRPFAPWFMRIVVNNAIKSVKRGPTLLALDGGDGAFELEIQSRFPSPEEAAATREFNAGIWEAMKKLTPKQRTAVVMRYYLEMSEKEMAERLEVAPGTVKWRLHTARERLRQLLEVFG